MAFLLFIFGVAVWLAVMLFALHIVYPNPHPDLHRQQRKEYEKREREAFWQDRADKKTARMQARQIQRN